MIPFGTQKVTLYRHTDEGWERRVLNGCSWRTTFARSLYDNAMRSGTATCVCRWAKGGIAAPGDVLIRGVVRDEIHSGVEIAPLMEKYRDRGAFICESFSDNTLEGLPIKHFCARGQAYGA